MRSAIIRALGALAAVAVVAAPAAAQGTLAGQGFGYPPGQLGPRGAATGGAVAEHDAGSAVNPAALGLAARTALFFQYSPEFRTTEAGGAEERTSTARFPLFGGYARVGDRMRVGFAFSTLLDRSFAVDARGLDVIDGDTVSFTDRFRNEGGIADARLAASWRFGTRLHVGLGLHAYTGENRLTVERLFGDTTNLPLERRTLSFSGGGVSLGTVLQLSRDISVAASARKGTDLRIRSGDTLLRPVGQVPDRAGAAVAYTGITGTTLAARLDWTGWSSMAGIAGSSVQPEDQVEYGVGADVAGPRVGDRAIMLRAGFRARDLPFGVRVADASRPTPPNYFFSPVSENEITAGFGIPLAYERSMLEVAAQRASRSGAGAKETAWILTFGLTVRP